MKRIIISGGGTGGHIFPAIAIANAIKALDPSAEILFVGAKGRMEMEKVPAAGYEIVGLTIQGFQRSFSPKNLLFPFKVLGSLAQSFAILKKFKPNVVVGVGGYASGPLLFCASLKGIPYLIQEQNSYAGITNKLLGKKAQKVCVAFEGMEQFFPSQKIMITGNPVRDGIAHLHNKKEEAMKFFGLDSAKKVILILGGSLGARTLNQSVLARLDAIPSNVQVIWQCGKLYYTQLVNQLGTTKPTNIHLMEFISKMDFAYAAADVIISRAGAGTIAELCLVAKPVVLVPSPNVAEDHQTKNAMALVKKHAALLVRDAIAKEEMISVALALLSNTEKQQFLSENIKTLAMPNAAEQIAQEVIALVK